MPGKPARALVGATLAVALLGGGLAACGSDKKDTAAAGSSAGSGSNSNSASNSASSAPSSNESNGTTTAALMPMGTGNPFDDAKTAASHMPMTASALAGGIAKATKMTADPASPASELLSNLTYMLTEHVYLAGIAVATAYHFGADSPEFKAAAATLDSNSVDISKAIGSVAPDEEQGFLDRWRTHITDFVNYAVAAKGKDAAKKKQSQDNLAAYAKSSGAFFEKISGGALPAKAVQQEFEAHIATLSKAIDAFAAGDTKAYDLLKAAGDHMAMSAAAIAGGVDKAKKLDGATTDDAAKLRASLTAALTSHVYLASVAVFTAYTAGADSDAFKASAAALDKNSVEISDAVGSIAGKDKGAQFLTTWRSHINDFVTYAVGDAANDQAKKDQALANLDAYRTTAGKFFESITNGALPATAVADELKAHVETLAGAIDSLKMALVK